MSISSIQPNNSPLPVSPMENYTKILELVMIAQALDAIIANPSCVVNISQDAINMLANDVGGL